MSTDDYKDTIRKQNDFQSILNTTRFKQMTIIIKSLQNISNCKVIEK